jgi:hypothetical protein
MSKAVQLKFHNVVSKTSLVYGSECWIPMPEGKQRIGTTQLTFFLRTNEVSLRDKQQREDKMILFEVNRLTDDINVYRKKWSGNIHYALVSRGSNLT